MLHLRIVRKFVYLFEHAAPQYEQAGGKGFITMLCDKKYEIDWLLASSQKKDTQTINISFGTQAVFISWIHLSFFRIENVSQQEKHLKISN